MIALSHVTRSAAETEAIAASLAEDLRAGDVLLLRGGIGAGKTVFTKGVARGLGVPGTVVSPTYLLHGVYRGRLPLHHFDFYRLDDAAQAEELGVGETAASGLTVIEWGDRFPGLVRPPYVDVHLSFGEGPDDRALEIRLVGAWDDRAAALAGRVAAVAGRA